MKLFGITGGVGMGKSTVGGLLERRGVAVTDTDRLARHLVEPGQPVLKEVASAFGPAVLSPVGELDRKELARLVFADAALRTKLEAILHPKIRELWAAEVEKWRTERRERGAIIIPLLYETKAESHFDAVICVACSASTQSERLLARGWSRAEICQRLEAQWPIEEKMSRADFLVWTDNPEETLAAQLDKVLEKAAQPVPDPT